MRVAVRVGWVALLLAATPLLHAKEKLEPFLKRQDDQRRAAREAVERAVAARDASVERMTMAPVSPAIDFSFDFQDLLFTRAPDAGPVAKTP